MDLLQQITHCPNVQTCLENKPDNHPCSKIVVVQQVTKLADFQVPEPWSGYITQAPILFLSSNPSISDSEFYPTWDWSEAELDKFFTARFEQYIKNGNQALQQDKQTYSKAVKFWSAVRGRAKELLEREVIPGKDYVLSEVVHCKSQGETGVKEASFECASRYLRPILELAKARVIVVLGRQAKEAVKLQFGLTQTSASIVKPTFGGCLRYLVFLPHPNAFSPKSFSNCLTEVELRELETFLHQTKP